MSPGKEFNYASKNKILNDILLLLSCSYGKDLGDDNKHYKGPKGVVL